MLLFPALQKHFVKVFSYLPGDLALKKGGDFGEFLWSRPFPGKRSTKILEIFGENSEENPGENSGRKFGELSFCNFSDLNKRRKTQKQNFHGIVL